MNGWKIRWGEAAGSGSERGQWDRKESGAAASDCPRRQQLQSLQNNKKRVQQ